MASQPCCQRRSEQIGVHVGDLRAADIFVNRSIGELTVRDVEIALGKLTPREGESGMTKGQASPTTEPDWDNKLSPGGTGVRWTLAGRGGRFDGGKAMAGSWVGRP